MLYLRKASDDLVSHCRCPKEKALIASPGQVDCPWCGCGYLFSCIECRKSFVFAEPVEIDKTLEEIGRIDAMHFYGRELRPGTALTRHVNSFVKIMPTLLGALVLGKRYVYLDGFAHVPEGEIGFRGWHGVHWYPQWPHVTAKNVDELVSMFDRRYWDRAEKRASMS